MGGWFVCRTARRQEEAAALAFAAEQLSRHGLVDPQSVHTAAAAAITCRARYGVGDAHVTAGDDFCAVAGRFVYRDRQGLALSGTAALRGFLADFDGSVPDWSALSGQFALLVKKFDRLHVLSDPLGAFQIFHTADYSRISTSMLALVGGLDQVAFDTQGLYEFLFALYPLGNDTVFEGIKRLPPRTLLTLEASALCHTAPPPPLNCEDTRPLAAMVEDHLVALRATVQAGIAGYGDGVQCPLTGGFDSRLAFALLRDAGVTPHVYVYGAPGGSDVQIATMIAAGEGLRLEVKDKSSDPPIAPDAFPEQVLHNFHEVDALATDAGFLESGANSRARHDRHRGGTLAVSGGGGEVFRNFFYLPNRRLTARQLVQSFYGRYVPGDVTDRFDANRYEATLTAKIIEGAGALDGNLSRQQVDAVYPFVRVRSFFGREISIVGRFGGYLLPFLDSAVIAEALRLPMYWKNFGRFEAELIKALSPRLAAYPSSYGHALDTPPPWRRLVSEGNTLFRPTLLRRFSYRVRRALGPVPDDQVDLTAPDYLGRVINLDFPALRRYLRPEQVRDAGLYRRMASLEYLAQWLGSRYRDGG